LPSDSEGFPKVVAEAAAYGCIPIVSAVSSIPQYVNSDNGFLLHDISSAELKSILHEIFEVNSSAELKKLSINIISLAKKFTFEYYNQRVLSDICETHK
jgi:glycosyltransferase involved in cell wall biosynthesis